MIVTLNLLIIVVALVFLGLAAFNVPGHPRVTWGWLGMFLWLLTVLLGGIKL